MVPIDIIRSIGLTSVCGQLLNLSKASRERPTSAIRSSHTALRCGSSASAFTVLMPTMVSPSVAAFHVSHRFEEAENDHHDDDGAQEHDRGERRIQIK